MFKGAEFYVVAAEIMPLLLVAVIFETKYFNEPPEKSESLADSVWFIGFFSGTMVAEMLAFDALLEERKLDDLETLAILGTIFYAFMLLTVLPIRPRVSRVLNDLPQAAAIAVRIGGLVGVLTIPLLATFNVLGAWRIGQVAAGLVLLLMFGGRALAVLAESPRQGGD